MNFNYRRFLIRFFTFIGGLYFFLEFILPEDIGGFRFGSYHDQISYGGVAISTMAIGLGIINIFALHGSKLIFKKSGWINSLALLAGLVVMLFVTAADWRKNLDISEKVANVSMLGDFAVRISKDFIEAKATNLAERNSAFKVAVADLVENERMFSAQHSSHKDYPHYDELLGLAVKQVSELPDEAESFESSKYNQLYLTFSEIGTIKREWLQSSYSMHWIKKLYDLLYNGLFVALGSAMFALLGFYIAAAAYRAFRIKSVESGLMMTAAVLVMLGQIPFGIWLWSGFPELRMWLLEVPSSAAFRAIKIGASVAGLIMALRMWLSIESESFSDGENAS